MTLAELGKIYSIKPSLLGAYAKANGWKDKRRAYRKGTSLPGMPPELIQLTSLSDRLELVLAGSLGAALSSGSGGVDTKNLKELASVLKDAVAVRREICSLRAEMDGGAAGGGGITLALCDGAEEYGV